jgi:hypothetical protein
MVAAAVAEFNIFAGDLPDPPPGSLLAQFPFTNFHPE